MSIFLYVSGDGDYGALTFKNNYNTKEVYEEMKAEGVSFKDYGEFWVEIKEFGDVDDDFVSFVKDNLCDYDALKTSDIYRVK